MPLRIMVSRHSAFYSPLISTIAAGFLEREGIEASYAVLEPGQRPHELIRDSVVDVMQSAVASNWKLIERGTAPLPVHFAQINRRDGFFLAARSEGASFDWKNLEGSTLLADHGVQPLAMLKFAAQHNGVDWSKIKVVDAGPPEEMDKAFLAGAGHYLHRQAPGSGLEVVSVGASMPEVAFSSLCCSREFLSTSKYAAFVRAYSKCREWVRKADPLKVALQQARFFPKVEKHALAQAVRRYQELGCWEGSKEIPRDLYEQALDVFEFSGLIETRPAYDEVCLSELE